MIPFLLNRFSLTTLLQARPSLLNISRSYYVLKMPDPVIQPQSPLYLYWRLVVQKRGGRLYLHKLRLNPVDDGSMVMQKLRQEYNYVKSLPPYGVWDKAWIFWKPVVEVATLSEVCPHCVSYLTRPIIQSIWHESKQLYHKDVHPY